MFKRIGDKLALGVGLVLASAGVSHAAFTLPSLPVADIEAAGVAVAALVAVFVVIKLAIRMIKGA